MRGEEKQKWIGGTPRKIRMAAPTGSRIRFFRQIIEPE
jgi:hypothetical protein